MTADAHVGLGELDHFLWVQQMRAQRVQGGGWWECGPREMTGDANFSLTMEYKELLIRFSSSAGEFAVMNYAVHIMK